MSDDAYTFGTKVAKNGKIYVSHINVRQSISLLLFKLIFLELIAGTIFITLQPVFAAELSIRFPYFNIAAIGFYLAAVCIKMIVTAYIVLLWLNEYYEISPKVVLHKSGIFFVKKEQMSLDDIQSVSLRQGVLGRLLNFGTLSLYDWKWGKREYLYAIHNPMRYLKILESLLPAIDEEQTLVREDILKRRE